MLLIAICTICIMLTLLYGANNQVKMLTPEGKNRVVVKTEVLISFALILIIISTLRYGFIDTYAYKIMYRESRGDLLYVNSSPWGVEAGWLYLMYYLNYITASPKAVLFMTAFFINVAFVVITKKYSANVVLSLFMYFCTCFLDTNNGLRQWFATSITMMAFPLLLNKRYVIYAIIVAFSSLFHESAILVLIIALISVGKPFNLRIIIALVLSLIFIAFPSIISGLIKEATIDSKYNFYLSMDSGMGFIRCFIMSILPLTFALIYFIKNKSDNKEIGKEEGTLINVLLLNSAFYIMGLYMQYWARLAFYTTFAPIVMMPRFIEDIFSKSDKRWVKLLAYLCYFVFFVYNVYVNISYGAIADFRVEWW